MSTVTPLVRAEGNRVWFTADTHYSHANICRGTSKWPADETRPFDSIEEMNQVLVDGINANIPPDGVLFHLGDWSFAGEDKIAEFRQRLNVRTIHLILGNHDHHLTKGRQREHFASVSPYLEIEISGQPIVLFHYGMRVWNASHKGSWALYGHSHGSLVPHGRSFDVGVDTRPYEPYSFFDVQLLMAEREMPIVDHHGLRVEVT